MHEKALHQIYVSVLFNKKHNYNTESFVKTRRSHSGVFCKIEVFSDLKKRLQTWNFIEKETLPHLWILQNL